MATVTSVHDGCASVDPLATANAFEAAGRTRRALRAIRALPKPCAERLAVKERESALEAFLRPAPAVGDETARADARKLLVDGDAALVAGNEAAARAAWEKSWATFHPNGAALVRLGELARKSEPVAAHRFFERAASDFTALVYAEPVVDAYDLAPYSASFLASDPRMLAASDGATVTIFQDGVARAKVQGRLPVRAMTIVDGELTLDDTSRWDLITGRRLGGRTPIYESESASLAISAIDQGFRFVDPRTMVSLGEIAVQDARTFPAFAGGGGHVYFAPNPPVTTVKETRAIQVRDDTGWHARLATITTRRSAPTLVHATLRTGKLVRHTLTFSCVASEGPAANPRISSYTGVNEKDHCDEPSGAVTSEDGRLTVVQRRVSTGSFLHVTGALTVTDFGARRTDLTAPEGQSTNAVALSKDGAQLVWQFGETTRLYATTTMKVVWETTKLARATHATFSATGAEVVFTTPAGIVTVESATGAVLSTLAARVPTTPSAMAGSSGGLAFAVTDSVAFVTAEGIAYIPASAPIEALRLSARADRVVALAAGRPTLVMTRSGSVAKLAPTSVAEAAFSADGAKVLVATGNTLELYDATTGAIVSTVTKTYDPIRTFVALEDRILIGSGDELSTYDVKAKSTTSIHLGSTILRLAASADQSLLVALTIDSGGGRVYAYDVTGRERFNVALHARPRDLVAYADHFVVTIEAPPEIRVSSLQSGLVVASRPFPVPERSTAVAATPTQLLLHDGPMVRVGDPLDLQTLSLAFLPGRQALVSANGVVEVVGGTPTCRAGAIFVPLEVCDGLLAEGTLGRALATKP